jgi:hypothetical protein
MSPAEECPTLGLSVPTAPPRRQQHSNTCRARIPKRIRTAELGSAACDRRKDGRRPRVGNKGSQCHRGLRGDRVYISVQYAAMSSFHHTYARGIEARTTPRLNQNWKMSIARCGPDCGVIKAISDQHNRRSTLPADASVFVRGASLFVAMTVEGVICAAESESRTHVANMSLTETGQTEYIASG